MSLDILPRLPHLDVTEVVATPAPDKDGWLGAPFPVRRFDYHSLSDDDMHGLADRSPATHKGAALRAGHDHELGRPS